MKKIFIILTLISMTGCSIFGGTQTTLTVSTPERDAQIYVNGIYQGTGTISTSVPRKENASVLVKKEGFYPAQRQIPNKLSALGILDIIGGFCFLIPFIGLAFPGAWTVDQSNVAILLEKEK